MAGVQGLESAAVLDKLFHVHRSFSFLWTERIAFLKIPIHSSNGFDQKRPSQLTESLSTNSSSPRYRRGVITTSVLSVSARSQEMRTKGSSPEWHDADLASLSEVKLVESEPGLRFMTSRCRSFGRRAHALAMHSNSKKTSSCANGDIYLH